MSDFVDCHVIDVKYNAGLIIQRDDTLEKGYIPKIFVAPELRDLIFNQNSNSFKLKIRARFFKNSEIESLFPIYTQRLYYQEDMVVTLELISEIENKIIVKDLQGFTYPLQKTSWEKGPLYKPFEIGSKINCKVVRVLNDYPYFERQNIINPYFLPINKIVNNKSVIKSTFEIWVKETDDQYKLLMVKNYDLHNPNWMFSYLNLLEKKIYEMLERFEYDICAELIHVAINIEKFLINSGFLLTQNPEKRETTKSYIKSKIEDWELYLKSIEIVSNIVRLKDYLLYFNKEIKNPDHILTKTFFHDLSIFNFILKHSSHELIDNNIIESIIDIFDEYKVLYKSDHCYVNILICLSYRKKYFRKKIFASSEFKSYKDLENNEDLKHFIYLETIDYKNLFYSGQLAQASLLDSSINMYQAYYENNVEKKKELVKKSVLNLLSQKPNSRDFDNQDQHIQWSWDKNILLGRLYEFSAYLEDDISLQIEHLKLAEQHFKRGRIRRCNLMRYYIKYNQFILDLHKNDISYMAKDINDLSTFFLNNIKYKNIFPIVEYYFRIFRILSLLNDNNFDNNNFLLIHLNSNINIYAGLPNSSLLSGIVLALSGGS